MRSFLASSDLAMSGARLPSRQLNSTRVKNSLRVNILGLVSEHFLKEIINVLNTDRALLRVERNTTTGSRFRGILLRTWATFYD